MRKSAEVIAIKLGDEMSWLLSLEALSDDGGARLGACNAVDQALGTSVQAHGSTQICLDLTVVNVANVLIAQDCKISRSLEDTASRYSSALISRW